MRLIALLLLLAALSGCAQVGYYAQSVGGQMELWRLQRPISEWLADPATSPDVRTRLERVAAIRHFASQALQLPDNGSYRKYADLKRPYVVWNVFAAEEFSVQARQSCFLFVGCVAYRGYFAQADAERHAAELREQGLEVYVSGVPAYSTLGWFDDPVLNTFLHYPEAELARIVFHELAHQVVYLKDDTVFNESFAVAVETEGVQRWIDAHGTAPMRVAFAASQQRRDGFLALFVRHRERLAALYASGRSAAEMRAHKHAAFETLRAEYAALKVKWGGFSGYDRLINTATNNATVVSVALYTQRVPAFSALIAASGGDMIRFYETVRTMGTLAKAEREMRLDQAMPMLPVPAD